MAAMDVKLRLLLVAVLAVGSAATVSGTPRQADEKQQLSLASGF